MDISEVQQLWEEVKNVLSNDMPAHVFETWVTPLEAVDFDNNTLVLLSPQQMSVNILKNSWTDTIRNAIRSLKGEEASFSLNYDAELGQKYIKKQRQKFKQMRSGQTPEDIKKEEVKKSLAQMQSDANLNLNLKFENFVVGENSNMAYRAALAVAKNPSKKFNPLFIYGSSGLGKTHLLQAIGHYILFNTKLKVRYIRMEEYFNEWIKCFQLNELPNGKRKNSCNNSLMRKFHQKFQNVDVLLMDDIQFIESRAKTMEEFFSTFQALYQNNKQIVIASDREPKNIPNLDKRLRTRFEEGLVVEIVSPPYDTRVKILEAYADESEVKAGKEVFDYIAQNFTDNVRELKGAFNKVSFWAEINNCPINLECAQKALKLEMKKRELTPELIAEKVCGLYGVSLEDIKSSAKNQKVSKARQLSMYLCREVLNLEFETIGKFFNKKHTTALYAYDSIRKKLKTDDKIQADIDTIMQSLKD